MPHHQKTLDFATPETKLATPNDRGFLLDLQKKFTNEIGFIPAAANEWYLAEGRVRLALENGEPCGFVLGRDRLRWNVAIRPITQAAIYFDAQRRHHGISLVNAVEADAREAGQVAIQACCREGLESNEFWRLLGFEKICELQPENSRRKAVVCWRKLLTQAFLPVWFLQPPPVAGYRAAKTRTKS